MMQTYESTWGQLFCRRTYYERCCFERCGFYKSKIRRRAERHILLSYVVYEL